MKEKKKMLIFLEHHCNARFCSVSFWWSSHYTYDLLLSSIIALWIKKHRFIIFLLIRVIAIGVIPHSCPFVTILCVCVRRLCGWQQSFPRNKFGQCDTDPASPEHCSWSQWLPFFFITVHYRWVPLNFICTNDSFFKLSYCENTYHKGNC